MLAPLSAIVASEERAKLGRGSHRHPLTDPTRYGNDLRFREKDRKVLIVHEDKVFSGFGAEIAGIVGTEMFRYLDAPIQRVGSTFTPVGFHPVLEKAILPGEERIYNAAKALLEY